MVATNSTMLALGTPAPDFKLPDTTGKTVSLADFRNAKALVVAFICNHCPYVKHIRGGLAKLARDFQPLGLAMVGINSNDVANYPADSPAKMPKKPNPPVTSSPTFTTTASRWRRLFTPLARRTFFCSTVTSGWSIAAS